MKRDFLGDSYNAVKRLWQQVFAEWAPLYAEPRFIPEELREDFIRLTRVPMRGAEQMRPYSILNDPDTGVRLPDEANQAGGRTHITLDTIAEQLRESDVRCVVTFDQSDYRHSELKRDQQRQKKMAHLINSRCFAFYYVSHAPFLFAFPDLDMQQQVQARLGDFGIPEERLEFAATNA
jgi:hypothetical protein